MIKLYGFSFLKDGERFDYPYKEMLTCMGQLVEKCYLALGENDDGTSGFVSQFPHVKVIPTVWDMSKIGDGGLIFSEQTNIALKDLRNEQSDQKEAWGIYLQSDEIIHESEFDQLRKDIEQAQLQGCDAVRFRYFHFWMSHYEIAVNKRWYPHEIRAVKLDSDVVNHGDAQGFSGFKKVYESDVHIFHYGHVRDLKKREEKQKELIRKIRPGQKFKKYLSREKKAFAKTKSIPIRLQHSEVMKERILKMGEIFDLPYIDEVFVVGDQKDFSQNINEVLHVKNIKWCSTVGEVPKEKRRNNMVIFEPSLFEQWRWDQLNLRSMESELAREWTNDQKLLFKISSKFPIKRKAL
tara:strand:- start:21485 stop:22537 length:1053 start_codon:yes stop_codon:yes gene_type:complete